jgi:ABC-type multidrug transport system fused ATPase/permease subunit
MSEICHFSSLRGNIGLVSQDPFLFDTSIRENLVLALPSSKDSDIIRALGNGTSLGVCKKSYRKGLDTLIGERGIRLSMGRKAKINACKSNIEIAHQ